MTNTKDNDGSWLAHQPWAIPVLLGVASLSIGFDAYFHDAWGAARSTCLYGALFCTLLFQRTGARAYRVLAVAGLVLAVTLMVIGLGLRKGWW
ncbi:MAG: hypothetical protein E6Q44_11325 [Flavobacteriales bacterium]|jgi:hypothetical protein|nr:MAG: hypothetical protein E6Q44_11325 [Flavobacteriales bacterium]